MNEVATMIGWLVIAGAAVWLLGSFLELFDRWRL